MSSTLMAAAGGPDGAGAGLGALSGTAFASVATAELGAVAVSSSAGSWVCSTSHSSGPSFGERSGARRYCAGSDLAEEILGQPEDGDDQLFVEALQHSLDGADTRGGQFALGEVGEIGLELPLAIAAQVLNRVGTRPDINSPGRMQMRLDLSPPHCGRLDSFREWRNR